MFGFVFVMDSEERLQRDFEKYFQSDLAVELSFSGVIVTSRPVYTKNVLDCNLGILFNCNRVAVSHYDFETRGGDDLFDCMMNDLVYVFRKNDFEAVLIGGDRAHMVMNAMALCRRSVSIVGNFCDGYNGDQSGDIDAEKMIVVTPTPRQVILYSCQGYQQIYGNCR